MRRFLAMVLLVLGASAAAWAGPGFRLVEARLKTPPGGGTVSVLASVRNVGDAAGTSRVTCLVRNGSNAVVFRETHTTRSLDPGETGIEVFPTTFYTSTPLDTAGNTFAADGNAQAGVKKAEIMKVEVKVE